ncbi:MAG: imidazolonepropionase [Candidatus Eisenbacteria bacterium]|nr:imidazolonepropionase [Candidatus Eisenbacteria bacterium]
MRDVSLLITGADQLVTVPPPTGGGGKRGADLAELGIIENGALAADGERIVAVGTTGEIEATCGLRPRGERIDARGCVVLPGFVDPHTHVLFAGTREWEFEERLRGRSYMEIAAAGGGIRSSVRMFRKADDATLLSESLQRLDRMAAYGTTTVEIKTGYALDPEQELRALRLIGALGQQHALSIVPTYLGAHEVPDDYRDRVDDYVELLTERMIPEAAELGIARFCDVFCEKGVFDVPQSRRILQAGLGAGLRPKLHADEIEPFGGAELAAELGAVSADHLGRVSPAGIAALAEAGVVAVLLPGTLFSLAAKQYAPARAMIDAGVSVALATDCNPGSSMTDAMPWVIALACLQMQMTPAEAISAATYNAAAALGLEGEVGSLTPGYRADLQLLAAPSYARLPYHVGSSDLRDLVVGGRIRLRNAAPPALRG